MVIEAEAKGTAAAGVQGGGPRRRTGRCNFDMLYQVPGYMARRVCHHVRDARFYGSYYAIMCVSPGSMACIVRIARLNGSCYAIMCVSPGFMARIVSSCACYQVLWLVICPSCACRQAPARLHSPIMSSADFRSLVYTLILVRRKASDAYLPLLPTSTAISSAATPSANAAGSGAAGHSPGRDTPALPAGALPANIQ